MRDRRSGDTEMKKIYIGYIPTGYKMSSMTAERHSALRKIEEIK